MSDLFYSKQAGRIVSRRRVLITETDVSKMISLGQDSQHGTIVIDLSLASGPMVIYPAKGEEWYVVKIQDSWALERRTSLQNTGMKTSANPGDWVLQNPNGRIMLIDKDGPLGSSGSVRFGTVLDRQVVIGSTSHVVEVLDATTGVILGYAPLLN